MVLFLFMSIFITLPIIVSSARTLVLVDNMSIRYSHSQFFKSLSDRSHELTFKSADDATLALFKYGEPLYDNLILFCPTVENFGGSISVREIVDFIDNGGNVLIGADSTLSGTIQELANEVNFEFDEEKTYVIDHMHYDVSSDEGRHTSIVAEPSQLIPAKYIVGEASDRPILFRGVGLVLQKSSPLAIEILTASSTAYSHNPDQPVQQYPNAVGKSAILIGALQARNNGRVLLTGSLEIFSDDFYAKSVQSLAVDAAKQKSRPTGNEQLAVSLTEWTFKEKGVLRVKSVNHHLVGQKFAPAAYTIKDFAHFRIEIEELQKGQWVPYIAPVNDIQMEFVRIDPFVRASLKADKQIKGRYGIDFQVPDVYGVYKFVVDYNRLGLTYLYHVTQVSVRPFEHTQFERFIRSAYPYYASAFSMMIALVIFSCVFLHYKEVPNKQE